MLCFTADKTMRARGKMVLAALAREKEEEKVSSKMCEKIAWQRLIALTSSLK